MGARLFAIAVFPAIAIGAIVVGASLVAEGIDLAAACLVAGLAATVALVLLEAWRPYRPENRFNADNQAFPDVAHYLLVNRVGGPLGGYVLAVGFAHLLGTRNGEVWLTEPAHWPFAVQVVAAWLLLGLLDYWVHRAFHTVDALWWIHAVHHDSDGVNTLKFGRVHVVEGIVNGASIVLLATVGMPWDALAVALAANAVLVSLAHANLDQRLWRPVHWVLPTVQLHRIHHARERALHDTNLGLPFYDLVFGTYTSPSSCPTPEMGRLDPQAPTSFLGQLWYPVRHWSGRAHRHIEVEPTR
jgi:ornithine lipid hydroxylase